MKIKLLWAILCLSLMGGEAVAEPIDVERLANAIYKAEGGAKTKHPYGILTKYKHTTPRQACINTINNQIKRHGAHKCGKDFITCLRDRYAPLGAGNDPSGLNAHWKSNVARLYEKELKSERVHNAINRA